MRWSLVASPSYNLLTMSKTLRRARRGEEQALAPPPCKMFFQESTPDLHRRLLPLVAVEALKHRQLVALGHPEAVQCLVDLVLSPFI